MKTNGRRTLVGYLMLTGLAVCFSAAMLSAEDWRVTFSLPSETHWGRSVLPAGNYCLLFNDVGNRPVMLLQQGTQNIAFVRVKDKEAPRTSAKSQLLIVREGTMATVHVLYVSELGTAFHFYVPERYEVYSRLVSQASKPVVIEHIPVIVSGK